MKKGFFISLFIFLFGILSNSLSVNAEGLIDVVNELTYDPVKVGFFYFDGYHEIDEQGNKSGMGYEITEMLKNFGAFDVEYVGYDKTWPEMFEMLDSGKVDILTNVNWSEERAEKYLFSDYDMGTNSFILSARPDEKRYTSSNYATYNGAKIGVLTQNIARERLISYAEEKDFCVDIISYDSETDLRNALLIDKSIDMVVSTNLWDTTDVKIVDSFYEEYCYIITRKSETEIMDKINGAISSVKYIYPNYFSELAQRYYGNSTYEVSIFTLSERQYIEKNKGRVYKALLNTYFAPMAIESDNTVSGIIPDYIKTVFNDLGFDIEFYAVNENDDNQGMNKQEGLFIRLDFLSDYNNAEKRNVRITIPYIDVPLSVIRLKTNMFNNEYIGIIAYPDITDDVIAGADSDFIFYKSVDEALVSLKAETISGVIVPLYTAEFLNNNEGNIYAVEPLTASNTNTSLSIAIDRGFDPELSAILSKAFYSTDDYVLRDIISTYAGTTVNQVTFDSFLAANPWVTWTAVIILLIIASVLILLSFKAAAAEREHLLAVDNFTYFKSIIASNVFALKFELKGNEKSVYFYQTIIENGESKMIEKKVWDSEIELNRLRVAPEDMDLFDEFMSIDTLRSIINSGDNYYKEIRVKDENGVFGFFSISILPLPSVKDTDRLLLFVKDITSVKADEEEKRNTLSMALDNARRFNDSKTLFLSQMSHDIRTPLNAIMGMTSIAGFNLDDKEKVKECLDIVMDSSAHLLSLVNDILDMSKLETGKMSFSTVEVDMNSIFDRAVTMHADKIKEAGLTYTAKRSEVFHSRVYSDPTRVLQVFSNIISNAVKYTDAGGNIDISLKELDSNKDNKFFYEFKVTDTGIGMDKETLKNLFQPFKRSKNTEFIEGSGLGMAITKSIIDALGGVISVDSKPHKGTTVTVSFAFKDSTRNSLSEYRRLNGKKALVVSPDSKMCEILTSYFEEGKMSVDCFANPVLVEDYLTYEGRGTEYAIVAVGLLRPLLDEIHVLRSLRERIGKFPVMFDVTTEDYHNVPEGTIDFGFDGFISYPCYKNSVIRVIGEGFERQKKEKHTKVVKVAEGKRALIVEDVEINAMFAQAIVEMKGMTSDIATNGQIAYEMLEAAAPGYYSIVLMDIQMPVLNGYEATAKIRASERDDLKSIPIIAMSANTFEDDILKCKDVGMNDHIAKPVDISRFSEIVDIYVKG